MRRQSRFLFNWQLPRRVQLCLCALISSVILLLVGSAVNAGRIEIDRKKESGVQAELGHNYRQAEIKYRQALAMAEKDPSGPALIPELLCRICTVSVLQGNHPQADLYFDRLFKVLPEKRGERKEDRENLVWLEDLAETYREYGVRERDLNALDHCIAIREYISGDLHPRLADTYVKAAWICTTKEGMLDRALAYSRKALFVNQKNLAADHPTLGVNHYAIGNISLCRGDYKTAESETKKAIDIYVKALGKDSESAADATAQLGSIYNEMGNFVRAEQLLNAALPGHRRAKYLSNSKVGLDYEELALVNYRRRNFSKGDAYLDQAISAWQKAFQNHEQVDIVLAATIKKYRKLGYKAQVARLVSLSKKLK